MRRTMFLRVLFLFSLVVPMSAQDISEEKKTAVKKAISAYIQQDQNLKGAFLIKDDTTGSVRELKFDYVHSGVHAKDGKYLACVDFKEGAKVLDLDFYVAAGASGELKVSEIVIHKIDGKPVPKK